MTTQTKHSRRPSVAEKRKYGVLTVSQAKLVATEWLAGMLLEKATGFGLPEVDDRYHVWRVPILRVGSNERIGECVIDARTSLVLRDRSTTPQVLEARLLGRDIAADSTVRETRGPKPGPVPANLRNVIAMGDSENILLDLPAESVHLVFTSPPYFNARTQYTDYIDYEDYLLKIRKVIHNVHRVLCEGRFFVINVAPVLLRRESRQTYSRRIAVPFDLHRIFIEEGFDFIDDIIWLKPEGAGWATGRGRRFAADRNPLQYKAVPVTEYVLVYRKRTEKLIDWHIRNHSDPAAVRRSRIPDGYERTNVWKIKPAHSKCHPAIFPVELAERVISYYSFIGEVVLDPFAGIGTVGKAATRSGRGFVLIEQNETYVQVIRDEAKRWLGPAAKDTLCINCAPLDASDLLL